MFALREREIKNGYFSAVVIGPCFFASLWVSGMDYVAPRGGGGAYRTFEQ